MGQIFSPKIPKAAAATALPQQDDEAARAAKLRKFAELDRASGASGNQLTESKLGDYSKAEVRTGASRPSSIITG